MNGDCISQQPPPTLSQTTEGHPMMVAMKAQKVERKHPTCSRCRFHVNEDIRVLKHKCPYRDCQCSNCILIKRRSSILRAQKNLDKQQQQLDNLKTPKGNFGTPTSVTSGDHQTSITPTPNGHHHHHPSQGILVDARPMTVHERVSLMTSGGGAFAPSSISQPSPKSSTPHSIEYQSMIYGSPQTSITYTQATLASNSGSPLQHSIRPLIAVSSAQSGTLPSSLTYEQQIQGSRLGIQAQGNTPTSSSTSFGNSTTGAPSLLTATMTPSTTAALTTTAITGSTWNDMNSGTTSSTIHQQPNAIHHQNNHQQQQQPPSQQQQQQHLQCDPTAIYLDQVYDNATTTGHQNGQLYQEFNRDSSSSSVGAIFGHLHDTGFDAHQQQIADQSFMSALGGTQMVYWTNGPISGVLNDQWTDNQHHHHHQLLGIQQTVTPSDQLSQGHQTPTLLHHLDSTGLDVVGSQSDAESQLTRPYYQKDGDFILATIKSDDAQMVFQSPASNII